MSDNLPGSDPIVVNKNLTLFFTFQYFQYQTAYNFLACVYPYKTRKRVCLLRNMSDQVDQVPNWKGAVTQFKLIPSTANANLYYVQDTDGDYLSFAENNPPFVEVSSDKQTAAEFVVGGLGSTQITLSQVYQGQNLGNVFSYGYDPTIGGSAVFLVSPGTPINQGNGLLSKITASESAYTAQFLYYEHLFLLQNNTNGTLVSIDTSDQYMIDGAGNNPSRQLKFRNAVLTPANYDGTPVNNLAYRGPALSQDLVSSNMSIVKTKLFTDDNWVAETDLDGIHYRTRFMNSKNPESTAYNSYDIYLTGINVNQKYVQLQSSFQICFSNDVGHDFIGSDNGKYYMSDYPQAYKFHMLNPVGQNLYLLVPVASAIANGTQFPELQSCYDTGSCTDPRYPNTCPDGSAPTVSTDSQGNLTYTCADKFLGKTPSRNCCQPTKQPFNCPLPLVIGQPYAFYSPSQSKWLASGSINYKNGILSLQNAEAVDNSRLYFILDQPDINVNGIMNGENAIKGHDLTANIILGAVPTTYSVTLTPNPSAYKPNTQFMFSDGSYSIQQPLLDNSQMSDLVPYQNLGSDKQILTIPQTVNVCNVCSPDGSSTTNTWYTCQDILGSKVCDANNQCIGVCFGKSTCTVDPNTLTPSFKCGQCSGLNACKETWQVCKPGVVSNQCCIADVDNGYCDDSYEETRCQDPNMQCDKATHKCIPKGDNGNGNQKYYQIAVGIAVFLLLIFAVRQIRTIYELRNQ